MCQLQKSLFKFEISSKPLAESHCPCSSKGQWPWENMDNGIAQRHFEKKFPFHLKHIHPQTPGQEWSLTTLLISPRRQQAPLSSPTPYKLKTNPNSATTVKIPLLKKENKPLKFKNFSSFKFLTNHNSFLACLIRRRFEWHRSPEKTAPWPCPHSLVIDTCWRCLSSFSLFNAEHRLWQSCPSEGPNYCSYFSVIHTKQHSCNRDISCSLPYSLWSKPGKCDPTSLPCPRVSLPTLVVQEQTLPLLLPFSEWHLSPRAFSFKIQILVFDEHNLSLCLASRKLNWCFPVKIHQKITHPSSFQILSIVENQGR